MIQINAFWRRALVSAAALAVSMSVYSQNFNRIPLRWKWIDNEKVIFSYDGTYTDAGAFAVKAGNHKIVNGVTAPEKYTDFPAKPAGAVNLTFSPDSSMLAFTRENDLYVYDIASGKEKRLTFDGSDTILNGYASWVYYEEIFGRPSMYRAFWWSPDSRKIGFYRFDNADVPVFPIYSPFSDDSSRSGMGLSYSQNAGAAVELPGMSPAGGSVRMTRYPKCGDNNPQVRIGIADVSDGGIVWADFNEKEDQYFGTPFWGADSKDFYIQREPRTQNTLDLYAVSVNDGTKKHIYHETYATWLDWIVWKCL